MIACWNCCIFLYWNCYLLGVPTSCSRGLVGTFSILHLCTFVQCQEHLNNTWKFIWIMCARKWGIQGVKGTHFIEWKWLHVNFDISMHLFLICFTSLCFVFLWNLIFTRMHILALIAKAGEKTVQMTRNCLLVTRKMYINEGTPKLFSLCNTFFFCNQQIFSRQRQSFPHHSIKAMLCSFILLWVVGTQKKEGQQATLQY